MSQAPKTYSPFWPIQIIIIFLMGWVGFQLYFVNSQRLSLSDHLDDLQNQLESANEGEKRMISLQQDLLSLAQKGNPYAQAIVKKHNLFVMGRGGNLSSGTAPNSPPPDPQGQSSH